MILTKAEQHAIRSLMNDSRFEIILKMYSELMEQWGKESTVGMNEFDTLRKTFVNEGKKIGLRELFEFVDKQGHNISDD